MLSTGFPEILAICLAGISAIGGAVAVFLARKCAKYAYEVAQFSAERAERRRVAELSAEMSDLRDAYDSLLSSHKKLRSRITMRENREKGRAAPADDAPDLSSEREKDKLRLVCRERGLLK